jgi:hypothetical protein
VQVDFCSETEVLEIHAGLDGHAGAREQPALVVRLEIVEMRAVAMDFLSQTMSCSVDEMVPESGRGN